MARRIIIESNTRIWMLPTTGWATASTNARDGFNTWSRICLWIAYLKSCWFDWTRDRSSTNFSRRDLLRDAIVPSSFAWTNRGKKSTIEISRKYLGRPAPGKISPGRSMIWIISREFDRPTFSPSFRATEILRISLKPYFPFEMKISATINSCYNFVSESKTFARCYNSFVSIITLVLRT